MDESSLLEEIAQLREEVERAITKVHELNARLAARQLLWIEQRPDPMAEQIERRSGQMGDADRD